MCIEELQYALLVTLQTGLINVTQDAEGVWGAETPGNSAGHFMVGTVHL